MKYKKMMRATVNINEVPTEIITCGRWIEEENTLLTGKKENIVIIITGNPGVPAFYENFAQVIHSKLSTDVPIWIIGQAGHTKPPDNIPNLYENTKSKRGLYDLQGNLEHKIKFIKQFVPPNAKIHIIAHSIGSWFTLNLLKDPEIANKVVKCYLLFPTIERMALSPNGQLFTNVILRISALLIFLAWIFTLFPYVLKVILVKIFGLFYGIPVHCIPAVLQLIHPEPLKRVFMLAKLELMFVKELDNILITQHKKKLFLYYGSKDGWTPIRYYEDLKALHPDIDAHLCRRGFQHAFVLKDSEEMGKLIGNLIRDNITSEPSQ